MYYAPIISGVSADIATLLTRLSALRAGYLDNLSAGAVAVSADIATLLTRLSALRAGYLDNLSAGAIPTSPVRSIQTGRTIIASGQATSDTTVTSVTAARAVVVYGGDSANQSGYDAAGYAYLYNATTVRAARVGTPATACTVSWVLLEYV